MTRQLALASLLVGGLLACGPKQGPEAAAEPVPEAAAAEAAPAAPVWNVQRRDEQFNAALSLLSVGTAQGAQQALDLLKEISENEPGIAEVAYNRGVAWLILGDVEKARKAFLRATDLDASLAVAWQNLGALAEEGGELDRALQSYRSGLRYAPEDGALRAAEIGILRQKGQYDAAVRQAKAAIQADSNNVGAYNQLGLVYLETGQLELAQFIYQRAMQIVVQAKSDPQMYANLGRVFFAQDQTRAAEEQFQKALALDPSLVLARLYIADMAIDNRDFETVVSTLEPTLAIAADNPAVHLNLGIGYRGTGRLEEAQKSYEKALELKPNDPAPYLNLAVLLGDYLKDYDQALGMLETYQRQGGQQAETVDAWRADFAKQKKRLEVEAKRRKRREDAERRRNEAAAAQRRIDEEKARKEAEAAKEAEQAAPPPAAVVPTTTTGPAADPSAANGPTAATPSASGPPAEAGPTSEPSPATPAPAAAAPAWGAEPVPPPPAAAAPAWGADPVQPPPAAEASAPTASPSPPPAAAAPPVDSAAESAGQSCAAVGSCGNGLECANDGICRPAAAPGTYGEGIGCFQDADCAYGLGCITNRCAQPGEGGSSSPWGN